MNRALLLSALAAASSGCVPEFDDDLSRVEATRVLGVRTTPAEVKPGGVVRLESLVALPSGEAARYFLCLERKPLTELGPVNPACLEWANAPATTLQPLGAGDAVDSVTIPNDACRNFGPSRPEPQPGEAAGRPVDPDPTGGYYLPIVVGVPNAATALGAVRLNCPLPGVTPQQTVEFNQRYRTNENPALSSLELVTDSAVELLGDPDREPARVPPAARVILRAHWPECPLESACGDGICGEREDKTTCAEDCTEAHGCSGAEPYAWFDPDRRSITNRRESIRASWYASAGTFEEERTDRSEGELETRSDNTWIAPAAPGVVTLWVVLRDSRGGQSWQEVRINVEP